MPARPWLFPTGRGWWFEPKSESLRAIVGSVDRSCVRSRRGRLMAERLLAEFIAIPVEVFSTVNWSRSDPMDCPRFERLSRTAGRAGAQ
jgi:hypothetical protein